MLITAGKLTAFTSSIFVAAGADAAKAELAKSDAYVEDMLWRYRANGWLQQAAERGELLGLDLKGLVGGADAGVADDGHGGSPLAILSIALKIL